MTIFNNDGSIISISPFRFLKNHLKDDVQILRARHYQIFTIKILWDRLSLCRRGKKQPEGLMLA